MHVKRKIKKVFSIVLFSVYSESELSLRSGDFKRRRTFEVIFDFLYLGGCLKEFINGPDVNSNL